jgi:hypothetical protein
VRDAAQERQVVGFVGARSHARTVHTPACIRCRTDRPLRFPSSGNQIDRASACRPARLRSSGAWAAAHYSFDRRPVVR